VTPQVGSRHCHTCSPFPGATKNSTSMQRGPDCLSGSKATQNASASTRSPIQGSDKPARAATIFNHNGARPAQLGCFDLPHSDAPFVKAYPAETTEAFLDGHVSAFAFFGGVPQSILYDNTKLAVARILGDGQRTRTRAFSELVSHFLFRDRFGRPGKGNDKIP
jgi:hypothetical protein